MDALTQYQPRVPALAAFPLPESPLPSPACGGRGVWSPDSGAKPCDISPESKDWSFSISPSNGYLGLISFRIDRFDLLAVQGVLKSLLQHHSSKASILWCSALFIVQLSLPYMTTGKTIALTRWTFVGKVMSLLFNMLSRFFTLFLPRSSVF